MKHRHGKLPWLFYIDNLKQSVNLEKIQERWPPLLTHLKGMLASWHCYYFGNNFFRIFYPCFYHGSVLLLGHYNFISSPRTVTVVSILALIGYVAFSFGGLLFIFLFVYASCFVCYTNIGSLLYLGFNLYFVLISPKVCILSLLYFSFCI